MFKKHPENYQKVENLLVKIGNFITNHDISLCDVALEVDAKLTHEAQYYMAQRDATIFSGVT